MINLWIFPFFSAYFRLFLNKFSAQIIVAREVKKMSKILMVILMGFVMAFAVSAETMDGLQQHDEDRIEYIIDTVLEASFNGGLIQDKVEFMTNDSHGLNKSDLLTVEQARILIDREGLEIKLNQLRNEISEKEAELSYLSDFNTRDIDLGKIDFVRSSLVKLENEIEAKNISNMSNYELGSYYLDSKYQYVSLAGSVDNIVVEIYKSGVPQMSLYSGNQTELEMIISDQVNNYSSSMLEIYLKKLGIDNPHLVDAAKQGELNESYLNETLREELYNMDSYRIEIIYHRINFKERLDYEEVVSFYEELSVHINESEILSLILQ